MANTVNRLRNSRFSRGKTFPAHWHWAGVGTGARQVRIEDEAGLRLRINAAPRTTEAMVTQEVACTPTYCYRVEATVSCDLTPMVAGGGFTVRIEPRAPRRSPDLPRQTPPLTRSVGPTVVRAYFTAPPTVRRVRVCVGIVHAAGWAEVESVRFIRILVPDEVSHPLALPAPPHTFATEQPNAEIVVCSATAESRPVVALLRTLIGESAVRTVSPEDIKPGEMRGRAVLLPDATPPQAVRSIASLHRLAERNLVVISLPAFARLARGAVRLRTIEQPDDPMHARVVHACQATQAFALHDVFPFQAEGAVPGGFRQDHFVKGKTLDALRRRNKLTVLLESMCERDSTSGHPICLHRPTAGGGLYVLDLEAAEISPSTRGDPVPAAHLLLSILGRTRIGLGQFTSPIRSDASFREWIREFGHRFEQVHVHEEFTTAGYPPTQLVTVGREDQAFGLPLRPKPLILVRSGLRSGDVDSVYGAWTWFKQLIRPEPFGCRYAPQLSSRFRFAWIPCPSSWEPPDGFARRGAPADVSASLELADEAELAAVIDVTSVPVNRVRIILSRKDETGRRIAAWFPRLTSRFFAPRTACFSVDDGEAFGDRAAYAWRFPTWQAEVVIDPSAFGEPIHAEAQACGATLLRIETPANDMDFAAHSIVRTGLVATALEHAIGLLYGLIAVNRSAGSVHFDGFPPIAAGAALMVDRNDPLLQSAASQAG